MPLSRSSKDAATAEGLGPKVTLGISILSWYRPGPIHPAHRIRALPRPGRRNSTDASRGAGLPDACPSGYGGLVGPIPVRYSAIASPIVAVRALGSPVS